MHNAMHILLAEAGKQPIQTHFAIPWLKPAVQHEVHVFALQVHALSTVPVLASSRGEQLFSVVIH